MILRLESIHFLILALLFTPWASAWPWPPSLPDLDTFLLRRQDNSNSQSAASDTASASAGSSPSQPSKTPSPSNASGSGTPAATTGGSAAAATSGGSTAAAQTSDVDPRLPAGGVNMITPSALAAATYYKIGEKVSFAWNYTSLSVTPSNIDILVSCSANQATYTLSNNASYASTGSVVWDTAPDETGTAPLLTETYTLVIHDAGLPVTAVASAGHLGSYNQFYFGMYVPQSYTGLSDGWTCAVCSAALSDSERQAMKFMFGMCAVTVLSFTWFVGGFGSLF